MVRSPYTFIIYYLFIIIIITRVVCTAKAAFECTHVVVILFLSLSGQLGGLDVDRAMYLLRIAMRDFMTRNSTRIEPHFFLHFSQNFPKLSWMLMPGTEMLPSPPFLG
jgi:hypothetical protein